MRALCSKSSSIAAKHGPQVSAKAPTWADIEPKQLFSFRWHPFAIDPNFDYTSEPMTLVTFTLAAQAGGTLLTVTETGFDQLIEARRAKAREMNDQGWAAQMMLITKYLAKHA